MDKLHYYLGTGLKFEVIDPNFETGEYELSSIDLLGYVSLNGINVKTKSAELFHFEDVQFHMRPLSSLTKEITVEGYNDGKPFVPIEELCRTFYGHGKTKYMISENNVFILCEHRNGESIYVHKDSILIDFGIMEKLFKWHIWPFDQSEFGKSLIEIKE